MPLLLFVAVLGETPVNAAQAEKCDRPVIRRAENELPAARLQNLNREPLADQEKAVMRRDGRGCMVPVKVREDVGDAQQR